MADSGFGKTNETGLQGKHDVSDERMVRMEIGRQSRLEEVLRKVRKLRPLILEYAEQGNRERRLPDVLADAFLKEDLYRVLVPIELGGGGLDPMAMILLVEEISSYDASVGWNFGIMASGSVMLGGLPAERLEGIFSDPDCSLAGSANPPGKACRVEGGYRITGRWGFGSAINNARWVLALAIVYDGERPVMLDDGKPETLFFLLEKSDVAIQDTWFTGGMCGTGSADWEVSDAFVAQSASFAPFSGKSEIDRSWRSLRISEG